ncbi:MAG: hypothetical protein R2795_05120 [Saprospiraceae bacterium]
MAQSHHVQAGEAATLATNYSTKSFTMQTTTFESHYAEADQLLRTADQELNRSEEDAVPQLIAHNAREAMRMYLAGFLLQQNMPAPYEATVDELLTRCQHLDGRFLAIERLHAYCLSEKEENNIPAALSVVAHCLQLAKQVRSIIFE